MKTPITINRWLIEATLKLLKAEAADLCVYVTPTTNRAPIKNHFGNDQGGRLASYELVMSYGEAFAIYSTLEIARQKYGNNRMFENMHLHTMTELWRDYVSKLENSNDPEISNRETTSQPSTPA